MPPGTRIHQGAQAGFSDSARRQPRKLQSAQLTGTCHLLRARLPRRRRLPRGETSRSIPTTATAATGFYPHASANVETRGEAVFAARNAVDGVYENDAHGTWPYQSWGINRDPSAALTIEFGRSVTVDELRLTLRADFPRTATGRRPPWHLMTAAARFCS